MTLVVGYADPDIGFMVADSLLTPVMATNFDKGPVAGKLHGLKIQIIHPEAAIAYASSNDADAALGLIRDLSAKIDATDMANLPDLLFDAYKQMVSTAAAGSVPDCEFLVLQIRPDRKKLAHVSLKGVMDATRAYIGDLAEYKKLIALRKPYERPKTQAIQQVDGTFVQQPLVLQAGENEFAEISNAMEELVHQRRGSTGAIAGCIIRVVDARISKKLEYLQAVEASLYPWEGHSGFTLLASNSGTRGVGIYYPSGRLGFLLIVGDAEHVRKENAATVGEFIEICTKKYGLELTGGKGNNWN
jgi:hypothetical protein